ncbi:MAG: TRAP transporter substrate-binding protein [Geminicoccaceae bacterium]
MIALRQVVLAGLSTALIASSALAAEVTLTVHHFLSPKAATQTMLIEPWAERITEQSDGRIAFEIFPSMSLGGKPTELYRQVRDGVADIVWTVPGYTPGIFPRVEVFELPTVHRGSALATNLAIQDLYDDFLAADFDEIHPLLVHVHSGNALHLADRPVRSLDDLSGMKLRTPSRTGAWMIAAWGAEPVGMPVPDLPQALSKGAIDGALIPFEVAMPLNVPELTSYALEGPEGRRFGTAIFLLAMNKARYEALPEDLRAIIDANSGGALAQEMGSVWDRVELKGIEVAEQAGNEIIRLNPDDMAAFDERGDDVVARWIEEVAARDIDGAVLVDAAREAIERHTPTN